MTETVPSAPLVVSSASAQRHIRRLDAILVNYFRFHANWTAAAQDLASASSSAFLNSAAGGGSGGAAAAISIAAAQSLVVGGASRGGAGMPPKGAALTANAAPTDAEHYPQQLSPLLASTSASSAAATILPTKIVSKVCEADTLAASSMSIRDGSRSHMKSRDPALFANYRSRHRYWASDSCEPQPQWLLAADATTNTASDEDDLINLMTSSPRPSQGMSRTSPSEASGGAAPGSVADKPLFDFPCASAATAAAFGCFHGNLEGSQRPPPRLQRGVEELRRFMEELTEAVAAIAVATNAASSLPNHTAAPAAAVSTSAIDIPSNHMVTRGTDLLTTHASNLVASPDAGGTTRTLSSTPNQVFPPVVTSTGVSSAAQPALPPTASAASLFLSPACGPLGGLAPLIHIVVENLLTTVMDDERDYVKVVWIIRTVVGWPFCLPSTRAVMFYNFLRDCLPGYALDHCTPATWWMISDEGVGLEGGDGGGPGASAPAGESAAATADDTNSVVKSVDAADGGSDHGGLNATATAGGSSGVLDSGSSTTSAGTVSVPLEASLVVPSLALDTWVLVQRVLEVDAATIASEANKELMRSALEWLFLDAQPEYRTAALLVVQHLLDMGSQCAALLAEHCPELLRGFWNPLKDPNGFIRELAASVSEQLLLTMLPSLDDDDRRDEAVDVEVMQDGQAPVIRSAGFDDDDQSHRHASADDLIAGEGFSGDETGVGRSSHGARHTRELSVESEAEMGKSRDVPPGGAAESRSRRRIDTTELQERLTQTARQSLAEFAAKAVSILTSGGTATTFLLAPPASLPTLASADAMTPLSGPLSVRGGTFESDGDTLSINGSVGAFSAESPETPMSGAGSNPAGPSQQRSVDTEVNIHAAVLALGAIMCTELRLRWQRLQALEQAEQALLGGSGDHERQRAPNQQNDENDTENSEVLGSDDDGDADGLENEVTSSSASTGDEDDDDAPNNKSIVSTGRREDHADGEDDDDDDHYFPRLPRGEQVSELHALHDASFAIQSFETDSGAFLAPVVAPLGGGGGGGMWLQGAADMESHAVTSVLPPPAVTSSLRPPALTRSSIVLPEAQAASVIRWRCLSSSVMDKICSCVLHSRKYNNNKQQTSATLHGDRLVPLVALYDPDAFHKHELRASLVLSGRLRYYTSPNVPAAVQQQQRHEKSLGLWTMSLFFMAMSSMRRHPTDDAPCDDVAAVLAARDGQTLQLFERDVGPSLASFLISSCHRSRATAALCLAICVYSLREEQRALMIRQLRSLTRCAMVTGLSEEASVCAACVYRCCPELRAVTQMGTVKMIADCLATRPTKHHRSAAIRHHRQAHKGDLNSASSPDLMALAARVASLSDSSLSLLAAHAGGAAQNNNTVEPTPLTAAHEVLLFGMDPRGLCATAECGVGDRSVREVFACDMTAPHVIHAKLLAFKVLHEVLPLQRWRHGAAANFLIKMAIPYLYHPDLRLRRACIRCCLPLLALDCSGRASDEARHPANRTTTHTQVARDDTAEAYEEYGVPEGIQESVAWRCDTSRTNTADGSDVDVVRHRGRAHVAYVRIVVTHLSRVAVADPSPLLRLAALRTLMSRDLEPAIASNQECVANLLQALQDQSCATPTSLPNRVEALRILGRLVGQIPSIVLPRLRDAFIAVLSDLDALTVQRPPQQQRLRNKSVVDEEHRFTMLFEFSSCIPWHIVELFLPRLLELCKGVLSRASPSSHRVPQASPPTSSTCTIVLQLIEFLLANSSEDAWPKFFDLFSFVSWHAVDASWGTEAKMLQALSTLQALVKMISDAPSSSSANTSADSGAHPLAARGVSDEQLQHTVTRLHTLLGGVAVAHSPPLVGSVAGGTSAATRRQLSPAVIIAVMKLLGTLIAIEPLNPEPFASQTISGFDEPVASSAPGALASGGVRKVSSSRSALRSLPSQRHVSLYEAHVIYRGSRGWPLEVLHYLLRVLASNTTECDGSDQGVSAIQQELGAATLSEEDQCLMIRMILTILHKTPAVTEHFPVYFAPFFAILEERLSAARGVSSALISAVFEAIAELLSSSVASVSVHGYAASIVRLVRRHWDSNQPSVLIRLCDVITMLNENTSEPLQEYVNSFVSALLMALSQYCAEALALAASSVTPFKVPSSLGDSVWPPHLVEVTLRILVALESFRGAALGSATQLVVPTLCHILSTVPRLPQPVKEGLLRALTHYIFACDADPFIARVVDACVVQFREAKQEFSRHADTLENIRSLMLRQSGSQRDNKSQKGAHASDAVAQQNMELELLQVLQRVEETHDAVATSSSLVRIVVESDVPRAPHYYAVPQLSSSLYTDSMDRETTKGFPFQRLIAVAPSDYLQTWLSAAAQHHQSQLQAAVRQSASGTQMLQQAAGGGEKNGSADHTSKGLGETLRSMLFRKHQAAAASTSQQLQSGSSPKPVTINGSAGALHQHQAWVSTWEAELVACACAIAGRCRGFEDYHGVVADAMTDRFGPRSHVVRFLNSCSNPRARVQYRRPTAAQRYQYIATSLILAGPPSPSTTPQHMTPRATSIQIASRAAGVVDDDATGRTLTVGGGWLTPVPTHRNGGGVEPVCFQSASFSSPSGIPHAGNHIHSHLQSVPMSPHQIASFLSVPRNTCSTPQPEVLVGNTSGDPPSQVRTPLTSGPLTFHPGTMRPPLGAVSQFHTPLRQTATPTALTMTAAAAARSFLNPPPTPGTPVAVVGAPTAPQAAQMVSKPIPIVRHHSSLESIETPVMMTPAVRSQLVSPQKLRAAMAAAFESFGASNDPLAAHTDSAAAALTQAAEFQRRAIVAELQSLFEQHTRWRTSDEWRSWFESFATTLLAKSRPLYLNVCTTLARRHYPIACALLPFAFLSHITTLCNEQEVEDWLSLLCDFEKQHRPQMVNGLASARLFRRRSGRGFSRNQDTSVRDATSSPAPPRGGRSRHSPSASVPVEIDVELCRVMHLLRRDADLLVFAGVGTPNKPPENGKGDVMPALLRSMLTNTTLVRMAQRSLQIPVAMYYMERDIVDQDNWMLISVLGELYEHAQCYDDLRGFRFNPKVRVYIRDKTQVTNENDSANGLSHRASNVTQRMHRIRPQLWESIGETEKAVERWRSVEVRAVASRSPRSPALHSMTPKKHQQGNVARRGIVAKVSPPLSPPLQPSKPSGRDRTLSAPSSPTPQFMIKRGAARIALPDALTPKIARRRRSSLQTSSPSYAGQQGSEMKFSTPAASATPPLLRLESDDPVARSAATRSPPPPMISFAPPPPAPLAAAPPADDTSPTRDVCWASLRSLDSVSLRASAQHVSRRHSHSHHHSHQLVFGSLRDAVSALRSLNRVHEHVAVMSLFHAILSNPLERHVLWTAKATTHHHSSPSSSSAQPRHPPTKVASQSHPTLSVDIARQVASAANALGRWDVVQEVCRASDVPLHVGSCATSNGDRSSHMDQRRRMLPSLAGSSAAREMLLLFAASEAYRGNLELSMGALQRLREALVASSYLFHADSRKRIMDLNMMFYSISDLEEAIHVYGSGAAPHHADTTGLPPTEALLGVTHVPLALKSPFGRSKMTTAMEHVGGTTVSALLSALGSATTDATTPTRDDDSCGIPEVFAAGIAAGSAWANRLSYIGARPLPIRSPATHRLQSISYRAALIPVGRQLRNVILVAEQLTNEGHLHRARTLLADTQRRTERSLSRRTSVWSACSEDRRALAIERVKLDLLWAGTHPDRLVPLRGLIAQAHTIGTSIGRQVQDNVAYLSELRVLDIEVKRRLYGHHVVPAMRRGLREDLSESDHLYWQGESEGDNLRGSVGGRRGTRHGSKVHAGAGLLAASLHRNPMAADRDFDTFLELFNEMQISIETLRTSTSVISPSCSLTSYHAAAAAAAAGMTTDFSRYALSWKEFSLLYFDVVKFMRQEWIELVQSQRERQGNSGAAPNTNVNFNNATDGEASMKKMMATYLRSSKETLFALQKAVSYAAAPPPTAVPSQQVSDGVPGLMKRGVSPDPSSGASPLSTNTADAAATTSHEPPAMLTGAHRVPTLAPHTSRRRIQTARQSVTISDLLLKALHVAWDSGEFDSLNFSPDMIPHWATIGPFLAHFAVRCKPIESGVLGMCQQSLSMLSQMSMFLVAAFEDVGVATLPRAHLHTTATSAPTQEAVAPRAGTSPHHPSLSQPPRHSVAPKNRKQRQLDLLLPNVSMDEWWSAHMVACCNPSPSSTSSPLGRQQSYHSNPSKQPTLQPMLRGGTVAAMDASSTGIIEGIRFTRGLQSASPTSQPQPSPPLAASSMASSSVATVNRTFTSATGHQEDGPLDDITCVTGRDCGGGVGFTPVHPPMFSPPHATDEDVQLLPELHHPLILAIGHTSPQHRCVIHHALQFARWIAKRSEPHAAAASDEASRHVIHFVSGSSSSYPRSQPSHGTPQASATAGNGAWLEGIRGCPLPLPSWHIRTQFSRPISARMTISTVRAHKISSPAPPFAHEDVLWTVLNDGLLLKFHHGLTAISSGGFHGELDHAARHRSHEAEMPLCKCWPDASERFSAFVAFHQRRRAFHDADVATTTSLRATDLEGPSPCVLNHHHHQDSEEMLRSLQPSLHAAVPPLGLMEAAFSYVVDQLPLLHARRSVVIPTSHINFITQIVTPQTALRSTQYESNSAAEVTSPAHSVQYQHHAAVNGGGGCGFADGGQLRYAPLRHITLPSWSHLIRAAVDKPTQGEQHRYSGRYNPPKGPRAPTTVKMDAMEVSRPLRAMAIDAFDQKPDLPTSDTTGAKHSSNKRRDDTAEDAPIELTSALLRNPQAADADDSLMSDADDSVDSGDVGEDLDETIGSDGDDSDADLDLRLERLRKTGGPYRDSLHSMLLLENGDPSTWMDARSAFSKQLAEWSVVMYLLDISCRSPAFTVMDLGSGHLSQLQLGAHALRPSSSCDSACRGHSGGIATRDACVFRLTAAIQRVLPLGSACTGFVWNAAEALQHVYEVRKELVGLLEYGLEAMRYQPTMPPTMSSLGVISPVNCNPSEPVVLESEALPVVPSPPITAATPLLAAHLLPQRGPSAASHATEEGQTQRMLLPPPALRTIIPPSQAQSRRGSFYPSGGPSSEGGNAAADVPLVDPPSVDWIDAPVSGGSALLCRDSGASTAVGLAQFEPVHAVDSPVPGDDDEEDGCPPLVSPPPNHLTDDADIIENSGVFGLRPVDPNDSSCLPPPPSLEADEDGGFTTPCFDCQSTISRLNERLEIFCWRPAPTMPSTGECSRPRSNSCEAEAEAADLEMTPRHIHQAASQSDGPRLSVDSLEECINRGIFAAATTGSADDVVSPPHGTDVSMSSFLHRRVEVPALQTTTSSSDPSTCIMAGTGGTSGSLSGATGEHTAAVRHGFASTSLDVAETVTASGLSTPPQLPTPAGGTVPSGGFGGEAPFAEPSKRIVGVDYVAVNTFHERIVTLIEAATCEENIVGRNWDVCPHPWASWAPHW